MRNPRYSSELRYSQEYVYVIFLGAPRNITTHCEVCQIGAGAPVFVVIFLGAPVFLVIFLGAPVFVMIFLSILWRNSEEYLGAPRNITYTYSVEE